VSEAQSGRFDRGFRADCVARLLGVVGYLSHMVSNKRLLHPWRFLEHANLPGMSGRGGSQCCSEAVDKGDAAGRDDLCRWRMRRSRHLGPT